MLRSFITTLILLYTCASPVEAAPIVFYPGQEGSQAAVACSFPVAGVGQISLRNSNIYIDKTKVLVADRDVPDNPPYLQGVLLKPEITLANSGSQIVGIVFFRSGSLMARLDESKEDDLVFRPEGSVKGRIQRIDLNKITMLCDGQPKTIALSEVIYIKSPLAFSLVINTDKPSKESDAQINAQVVDLTLKPTTSRRGIDMSSVVKKEERFSSDDLTKAPFEEEEEHLPFSNRRGVMFPPEWE